MGGISSILQGTACTFQSLGKNYQAEKDACLQDAHTRLIAFWIGIGCLGLGVTAVAIMIMVCYLKKPKPTFVPMPVQMGGGGGGGYMVAGSPRDLEMQQPYQPPPSGYSPLPNGAYPVQSPHNGYSVAYPAPQTTFMAPFPRGLASGGHLFRMS